MPRANLSTGIELEYETFGPPDRPTMLFVMGLGAQMIAWDDGFCERFVERGLHVVRFDNRDCGLSTGFDGQAVDPMAVIAKVMAGEAPPPVPYTLSDMAADAVGLLDHLGVDAAHVMGASMGGMIVQTMAIEHPERVRTMTSVMSMPGDPAVGGATPEARTALLAPPPTDREAFIAAANRSLVWASKRYGDADRLRSNAARAFDRAFRPEGVVRQLAAIYADGDRSERLARIDAPTLVVHGRDDTLIAPSGGERTAEVVPGATLVLFDDMGHDLPEPLWPDIVDAVVGHVAAHDPAVAANAA